jgi:Flp pilus assembly protein TadD
MGKRVKSLTMNFKSIVMFVLGLLLFIPSPGRSQQATSAQYDAAGNQFYTAKQYVQAARYYDAAIQLNPNDATAYEGLGNCYYILGRKQSALSLYQKSLALNPNNSQLAQFVGNLQGQLSTSTEASASTSTTATTTTSTTAEPGLQEGIQYFQQKQYSQAIPDFQEAIQSAPQDYRGYYYLGYCQYMTGDAKDAALNFERANQRHPNSAIEAYALQLEKTLSPSDQLWVKDQLNSTYVVANTVGFRFMPGLATFKMADFEDDAQSYENAAKQAGDVTYSGQAPEGSFAFDLQPYYRINQTLELGLDFGTMPMGNYAWNWNGGQGPSNILAPSMNPTYNTYTSIATMYTFNVNRFGLEGRIYFGPPPLQFFVGLGADYYSGKITYTQTLETASPSTSTGINGIFTATGVGIAGIIGVDYVLSSNFSISPSLTYQSVSISNFSGTMNNYTGAGSSQSGNLMFNSSTNVIQFQPKGSTNANLENLKMDLSGVQANLNFNLFF